MDEEKDSTNNVKEPDEEIIKIVTEKALEMLVARGVLVPSIYTDGAIKYRIANKLNRRRRD